MTTIKVKGYKYEDQTVKIKDKTHLNIINHIGKRVPTFSNMERQLIKSLK
jgi:hypothetical protein